jgi:hypothetical protein
MSLMAAVDLSRSSDAELLELTSVDAETFGVLYARFERDVLAFFRRATFPSCARQWSTRRAAITSSTPRRRRPVEADRCGFGELGAGGRWPSWAC